MMFNYVCEDDAVVFSVSSVDPSIKILPVVIGCPKCRKDITVSPKWSARSEVIVLSAEALFRASNGLPLPDAESASESRVTHLLTQGKIVNMKLVPIDQDRVLIEALTVKTPQNHHYTLHFATSTKGATIYKISSP